MFFCMLAYRRDARSNQPARKVRQTLVGISFEHIHMGDLLRQAHEHPNTEIVGVCDPDGARMAGAILRPSRFPRDRCFTMSTRCMRETKPDLAISVPGHRAPRRSRRDGRAARRRHTPRKPFAASLADADRILAAVAKAGVRLAINWPLRWYPPHVTAKRLIDEGTIGE